ncbi:uncharacterized protein [Leptinotarsa decemlineata]|uniref:uncharacterized protein n=1 Tax=Leptinotarsa decemlineata TaxID=7539 RepID=UPI003D306BB3
MPRPPQQPIVPSSKDDIIALDLYGSLIKSRGGVTYLLVVVNLFTKHVALFALKRATTKSILNRLIQDYFPKNGMPKRVLQDHGSQFTARLWKETLSDLGVQVIFCAVRHAAANPSERVMRELNRLFRTYCHQQHSRWAYEIPAFADFLNSVVHESTGFAPNELQYGMDSLRLLPVAYRFLGETCSRVPPERKLVLAEATLRGKAARRAERYPGKPYREFSVRELVLLRANTTSSSLKAETKKFLLLYEGPYKVKKRVSFATFVLTYLDEQETGRGTFNACHLKLYLPAH